MRPELLESCYDAAEGDDIEDLEEEGGRTFGRQPTYQGKVVSILPLFHVTPDRRRLVQLHFYAWLWSPDLKIGLIKKSFKT